jgi:hypothetical protein
MTARVELTANFQRPTDRQLSAGRQRESWRSNCSEELGGGGACEYEYLASDSTCSTSSLSRQTTKPTAGSGSEGPLCAWLAERSTAAVPTPRLTKHVYDEDEDADDEDDDDDDDDGDDEDAVALA